MAPRAPRRDVRCVPYAQRPARLPLLVRVDAHVHDGRADGVARPLQARDDGLDGGGRPAARAGRRLARVLPSALPDPRHARVELGVLRARPALADHLRSTPGLGRRPQRVPLSARQATADHLPVSRPLARGRRRGARRLPVQRVVGEQRRADEVSAGVLGRGAADGAARAGGLVAVDGLLQPGLDAVRAELVAAVQLGPRLDDALRVGEADRVVTYGAFFRRFHRRGRAFLGTLGWW